MWDSGTVWMAWHAGARRCMTGSVGGRRAGNGQCAVGERVKHPPTCRTVDPPPMPPTPTPFHSITWSPPPHSLVTKLDLDVLNARAGTVLVVARLGVHDGAANKQPKVGLAAVAAHVVANVEDGEALVSNTCRPASASAQVHQYQHQVQARVMHVGAPTAGWSVLTAGRCMLTG